MSEHIDILNWIPDEDTMHALNKLQIEVCREAMQDGPDIKAKAGGAQIYQAIKDYALKVDVERDKRGRLDEGKPTEIRGYEEIMGEIDDMLGEDR